MALAAGDLDAESVLWLEKFLHTYPGAVLAVTHDRYFLDNVAEGRICEVDRGHLYPYKGNYSTYLETKAARMAAQSQQDARLAKRMQAELEWVRSSPKARQAKNKARLERYEEMEAQALCVQARGGHRHPDSRGPAPGLQGPGGRASAQGLRQTACSSTT